MEVTYLDATLSTPSAGSAASILLCAHKQNLAYTVSRAFEQTPLCMTSSSSSTSYTGSDVPTSTPREDMVALSTALASSSLITSSLSTTNRTPRKELQYTQPHLIMAKLRCSYCREPLQEPRSTHCRHLFCLACIVDRGSCPTCNAEISTTGLAQVDPLLLELLDDLEVYCAQRASGCAWSGPRGTLAEHESRNCAHQACSHAGCSWRGLSSSRCAHQDACEHGIIRCSNSCSYSGPRKDLKKHIDTDCVVEQAARVKARLIARAAQLDTINPAAEQWVTLNVGGRVFQCSVKILCSERDSLLADLFAPDASRALHRDETGAVLLEADPGSFAQILSWLRVGTVVSAPLSSEQLQVLCQQAKRLGLERFINEHQKAERIESGNWWDGFSTRRERKEEEEEGNIKKKATTVSPRRSRSQKTPPATKTPAPEPAPIQAHHT